MDGVLIVDKPAGRSSHDVVNAVRRARGGRKAIKVGHAGTLDPFATGVLLVLLGRATRAQRWLMGLDKTYETVARFGATSTTGDPEGEITETGTPLPDGLVLPTGRIRQRPPVYSAIKIGGRRAYALARAGEEVEVPERDVVVHAFEELWREPPRVGLRVRCSSGTYIRSLVMDLGDAYCEELRRTAIGPFAIEDADEERVLPLGDVLARVLPVVRLEGAEAKRAGHGVAVDGEAGGEVLLVDEDGPIAVAVPLGDGRLKPAVGFRG